MDRETTRDYLKRSMFNAAQSEALSNVFADLTSTFATKTDLLDLKSDIADLRTELKTDIAAMEARIKWRLIGAMGLVAVLMALFDRFID